MAKEKLLYTEDTHSVALDGINAIQDSLKKYDIDVKNPNNVDILENVLYEIISNFLENHFDRGEYRNYN